MTRRLPDRAAAASLLLALAACGHMSLDRAEQSCFQDARLAAGPRGEIAVGTTSRGPRAKGEITISTDYLFGRDPAAVYASCVQRRAGQPPSRPLYDRPDWKG